jgi:PhnB protein
MTSIQPELWVDRGAAAVAFYESAFGARVLHRVGEGDDIVAQLAIGDAAFWIAATGSSTERLVPQAIGGATGRLLLVVDDPVSMFNRAVAAGATSKSPVAEEHGWRVGRVIDPWVMSGRSVSRSSPGRRRNRRLGSGSLRGAPSASGAVVCCWSFIGSGGSFPQVLPGGRLTGCASPCWPHGPREVV